MGTFIFNIIIDILFLTWSIQNYKAKKRKIDLFFIISWSILILIAATMIVIGK